MYEFPTKDQIAFQVGVYNKDVRALVSENKCHQAIRDEWAEVKLLDVLAHDEQEARRIIGDRYPRDQGYVVASIDENVR